MGVGVIGCGAIAQIQHLPHVREGRDRFSIARLCDVSAELLAKLGADDGVVPARRCRDYRDLLASDVEAVLICPIGTHAPHVIAAADAGKHVLVEKPLCYTPAQAAAMRAAADRAVTAVLAYEPGIRAVLSWVDLPERWDFRESLAAHGSRERVHIRFPTGFGRGLPTRAAVQRADAEGRPPTKRRNWHDTSFKLELAHFGRGGREVRTPDTPDREAVDHVSLVRDIVRTHLEGGTHAV